MSRIRISIVALVVVLAVTAGAMTRAASGGQTETVTITFWTGWTGREFKELEKVIRGFERKNPGIKVKAVSGIDDDTKILAAIRSGNPPDAVSSFSPSMAGAFCSTGAFIDLKPYLSRDRVNMSIFPKSVRSYTQFEGVQCALPLLTDAYGLYYNKKLLKEAGFNGAPRTLEELAAMAKKLTKRKSDGTIEVAGFVPLFGWYENTLERFRFATDARFLDASGKAAYSKDPDWKKLFRWQKSLVDWYGYKNLQKFVAGAGDEWSESNAFQTGKVAIHLDGEWRNAFIADTAKGLEYGTAPFPVFASHKHMYGSGQIGGTIAGIPRGSKNPDEAWKLVRYLTTDTSAVVSFSNAIKNVPTTFAAINSKELSADQNFRTFVNIFRHKQSAFPPLTKRGSIYLDLAATFLERWQAGKVTNLDRGLRELDKQVNAELSR